MKLLHTFLRDLKVSYRTFYVYIEIIMALIVVAVVLFVLPENFEGRSTLHLYAGEIAGPVGELFAGEGDATEIIPAASRDEVVRAMAADRSAQGASLSQAEDGSLDIEIILQGYEGEATRRLIEASLKGAILQQLPGYTSAIDLQTLDPNAQRLSDRISFLPMYLLLNCAFMGLFIVAAYVFMDKEEGTIRALTVTPVTVRDYLASKLLVMLFTGLLTGLLVTILVAGTRVHYHWLILILVAGNLFGTVLGLFIASFYQSILSSLGAMYAVIVLLALGGVSYYLPSFSPLILRILPSYPLLFAFREAFLQRPDTSRILLTAGSIGLVTALLFAVTVRRYRRTLTI